jgi:hypothetical protein
MMLSMLTTMSIPDSDDTLDLAPTDDDLLPPDREGTTA